MQFSSAFRAALVALFALAGAGVSSAADAGTIWISELKGGWFIGVSGGSGMLIFHGRRYPLSIGGLSAGLGWQGPPHNDRALIQASAEQSPWLRVRG